MERRDFIEKLKLWLSGSLELTGRYLLAKLLAAGISFAVCAAAFALIGVPLWGLLAFIVGAGSLLPYVGAWAGAVITALVSLAMGGGVSVTLWALAVILLLQILEEFLLEPLIMGRALEMAPLLVFLAVLAAGALFGFWGMVFALPAAGAAKLGYEIFYQKKRPSGKEPEDEKEARR